MISSPRVYFLVGQSFWKKNPLSLSCDCLVISFDRQTRIWLYCITGNLNLNETFFIYRFYLKLEYQTRISAEGLYFV